MKRLCCLALFGLLLGTICPEARAEGPDLSLHPMIGEPAPVFNLSTVSGQILDLEDLRGSIVLVHFGTSW